MLVDGEEGPFGKSDIIAIHYSLDDNEATTMHYVAINKLIAPNSINYLHPNSLG